MMSQFLDWPQAVNLGLQTAFGIAHQNAIYLTALQETTDDTRAVRVGRYFV
jgi:hypothetical protein